MIKLMREVIMKHILILVLLLFVVALSGCISESEMGQDMDAEVIETPSTVSYMDVTAAEAKALIDTKPDLIIIDVSPHYANGRLPGAVNYYLGDGSLDAAIPTLDKSKEYLVYCHVDSVSINGARKLINAGFTKVYRLDGNYAAWVAAGYEIEK
jgi:rhodanese-related sulfurtransferase